MQPGATNAPLESKARGCAGMNETGSLANQSNASAPGNGTRAGVSSRSSASIPGKNSGRSGGTSVGPDSSSSTVGGGKIGVWAETDEAATAKTRAATSARPRKGMDNAKPPCFAARNRKAWGVPCPCNPKSEVPGSNNHVATSNYEDGGVMKAACSECEGGPVPPTARLGLFIRSHSHSHNLSRGSFPG